MRKGFDGLSGLVRSELGKNPLSGDVFIFLNRYRHQVKLLLWERDGFSIYSKRLEKGSYELPLLSTADTIELTSGQLMLILEGISLESVRWRKRYHSGENS